MVSLESDSLIGLVAVLTLPAAALAELFVSSSAAGAVAIVGWLLLVPALGILADDEEFSFGSGGTNDQEEAESADDPLETLRSRYVRGDLTDAEFERQLERLLETEDVDVPAGSTSGASLDASVEPSPAGSRDRQAVLEHSDEE